MRVGADARVITPDLAHDTVFLAGFEPDRPAHSIHDDLMVRTIAFQQGDAEPVVLSVCDLVGLTRVHAPKGSRVVACTHTHHGPDGLGFWGRPFEGVSGIDPDYLARVRAVVAASQLAAISALEPAKLSAGSVAVPELVRNLRHPEVLDDELSVLRAWRADGSVIATFCDYACHPEVVDSTGHAVTADYAGHLCRALDRSTGGTTVFAVGALGGMQSPDTELDTHEEAERFGSVLATAVEDVLRHAPVLDDVDVSFSRGEVELPLENPIYELGMEMGLVPAAERRGELAVTEVSVIRVGPVGMACVPGELMPQLGFRLKDALRSSGATVPVIVGLADDELGYLIPEDDFTAPVDYLDPGSSYEESFSAGPLTGTKVCEAVEALLVR